MASCPLRRIFSPPPSSTAIWVVLFAVMMMFAAFSSALFVRKGGSLDWQPFTLPPILYFNTLLILVSSITLERARHRVASFMGSPRTGTENPSRWLYGTFVLGLLFVAGQYFAWRQLRAQGLYLASNPASSFFYLLTAVHALHVLGGLGGLLYVLTKLRRVCSPPLSAGCGGAVLAFHGCSLGVPAGAFVDQTVGK